MVNGKLSLIYVTWKVMSSNLINKPIYLFIYLLQFSFFDNQKLNSFHYSPKSKYKEVTIFVCRLKNLTSKFRETNKFLTSNVTTWSSPNLTLSINRDSVVLLQILSMALLPTIICPSKVANCELLFSFLKQHRVIG